MGKRLVIKTILICCGIFLVLSTSVIGLILKKYPLDMEKKISVIIAAVDIEPGDIIDERLVKVKQINQSASNNHLLQEMQLVIGKKAISKIKRGDYVSQYNLLEHKDWYSDDERIIVLPMGIEERMANLIRMGSYIDIRLQKEPDPTVTTVLHKVKIEAVLDETGASLDENSVTGVNARTVYIKLVLKDEQRQKLYTALKSGRLIYELYCDDTQKPII